MLIGLVCKMQLCWSIIPTSDEQQANRFELLWFKQIMHVCVLF
jgi:hypothetical protein